MDYRHRITEKGLKCRFIADKLGVKYPVFSLYINGKIKKIPKKVVEGLEEILK